MEWLNSDMEKILTIAGAHRLSGPTSTDDWDRVWSLAVNAAKITDGYLPKSRNVSTR